MQFIFPKVLQCHMQLKNSTIFYQIFKAVTVFGKCDYYLKKIGLKSDSDKMLKTTNNKYRYRFSMILFIIWVTISKPRFECNKHAAKKFLNFCNYLKQ